jgi:hypothetical protein
MQKGFGESLTHHLVGAAALDDVARYLQLHDRGEIPIKIVQESSVLELMEGALKE